MHVGIFFTTVFLFLACHFHFLSSSSSSSSVLLQLKLIYSLFMYSEFDKIFLISMSNSEVFIIKGDQEGAEFDILKRPSREFNDEINDATSSNDHPHELGLEAKQAVEDPENEEEKFNHTFLSKETVNFPELREFMATDHHDDDKDGFKTPTSSDHKIPVLTKCPPAPRKSKSFSSTKRKSVSSNARRSLRLDLSQEVESLFPQPILDDLHRNIKKARRENKGNL